MVRKFEQSDNNEITLRDRFAISIIGGIVTTAINISTLSDDEVDYLFREAAKLVYKIADIMIDERDQKG